MYDLWRVGFIRRPLMQVAAASLKAAEVTWIAPPAKRFQFIADPFGIERDGVLTVFTEAFDYRVRRGEIHFYQYDRDNRLIGQGVALAQPFHLSYPSLIQDGDDLYMLPEGYKSGGLTLYRCTRFPDRWEPVQQILDVPAIDATVIRHGDRWWMFHALPGPADRAMREMHVHYADNLTGPWTPHAANPVRTGFHTSRPGGSAFVRGEILYLPVQDCLETYGAAVELLRIDGLTPTDFRAARVRRFEPDGLLEGFEDGLHTLSGLGDVTFIDVKGIRRSSAEGWMRTLYKLRRLLKLNAPRPGASAQVLAEIP